MDMRYKSGYSMWKTWYMGCGSGKDRYVTLLGYEAKPSPNKGVYIFPSLII
jgi:hypothetical protein